MPSIQATALNDFLKQALKDQSGDTDIHTIRERNAKRLPPKLPADVVLRQAEFGGVSAEVFTKEGNSKGFVFYIHGGAFTFGSARERREITQFIAGKCGYDCVSTDYRLAPENKWPAQLDDCFASYSAFAAQCPDPNNIVLMGESAGGMLVLSLALLIKQKNLQNAGSVPVPKALVVLSPCVTHAEHFPSHSSNIGTDHILKDMILKGLHEPLFGGDVPEALLRDPIVSPLYGDYSGLPPVFISATDAETLYDDSRELYRRLKEAGHSAKLDVQEGCCHAFQIHPDVLPEAKTALERAFEFIG